MSITYYGGKEDIKSLIAKENWTMTEVAREMSKILGKPYQMSNLSQKLGRGTLKYDEAKMIADILGYEIQFVKISNRQ